MVTVSVVVPVFNNEDTVKETVNQAISNLSSDPTVEPEIVLVDDGSSDGSWSICERLAQANPEVVLAVRLSRNFGQVNALSAGLARASGDAVIVVSADLQDPIDLIPEMVDAWRQGSDVVIAHRSARNDPARPPS